MQSKNPPFETLLHLSQIYDVGADDTENSFVSTFDNLAKRFRQAYGEDPYHYITKSRTFYVRVPGTFYLFNGVNCSVSMNIKKDVVIAFAKSTEIVINSSSAVFYPTFKMELDPKAKIPEEFPNQKYCNYVRAIALGYKSALGDSQPISGFKCMVSVNEMPQNLGLGFHNALSLAIHLITLKCNSISMSKSQTLQRFSEVKHNLYQIQTGNDYSTVLGMKDAVMFRDESFQKNLDSQQYQEIYFKFLQNYTFIIADTLSNTPKLMAYNKRIAKRKLEMRLANKLMRRILQIKGCEDDDGLIELQSLLEYSDEDMLNFAKQNLAKSYSVAQIQDELQTPFLELIGPIPYVELLNTKNMTLDLLGQVAFQYKESIRAKQMSSILISSLKEESQAQLIGKLMDDSYDEYIKLLDEDFEEIKELRDELKSYKALGVKMIGIGWGGALVALVPTSESERIVNGLQDLYYNNPKHQKHISDDMSLYVFETKPSGGAVYLDPQYEIWF